MRMVPARELRNVISECDAPVRTHAFAQQNAELSFAHLQPKSIFIHDSNNIIRKRMHDHFILCTITALRSSASASVSVKSVSSLFGNVVIRM